MLYGQGPSRAQEPGILQLNLTGQKWGHMNLASSFLVAGYPIFATVVCKLQTQVSAFKNEYVMQQSRCQWLRTVGITRGNRYPRCHGSQNDGPEGGDWILSGVATYVPPKMRAWLRQRLWKGWTSCSSQRGCENVAWSDLEGMARSGFWLQNPKSGGFFQTVLWFSSWFFWLNADFWWFHCKFHPNSCCLTPFFGWFTGGWDTKPAEHHRLHPHSVG